MAAMARKKPMPAAPPANPQTQCALLSMLPPELRTIIWECVLYVQPDDDGTVALFPDDKTTDDKTPPTPTVLTLLLSCRLIFGEAAGIFYNMHNLFFFNMCLNSTTSFFRVVRSPARLEGIRHLTVTTNVDFQYFTSVCKEVSKYLPRLRSLTFEIVGHDTYKKYILERARNERYHLKKAVAKFPESFEKLRVVFPGGWHRDILSTSKELVDDVVSKLASGAKAEVVEWKAEGRTGWKDREW